MALLTIVIPSYNSERFIRGCLDSLLIGLDDKLDIIVVNDGSKDNTSSIAKEYADKYSFIRVVDKENGGHGSGINKGLELAKGLYFKVLDSDDKLDKDGLVHLLDLIQKHVDEGKSADIYVTPYYSVSEEGEKLYITSLNSLFKKKEEVISYKEFKKIPFNKYFMLHMFFVKTSILKDNNMKLLEKTFYEDNEMVLFAAIHANTLCFSKEPVYLYTVGREGQSISIDSMDKNYDSQVRVMYRTLEMLPYEKYKAMDKYHARVAFHCMYINTVLFYMYTHIRMNSDKKEAYDKAMKYFKETNPKLYRKLRYRTAFCISWLIFPAFREKITTKAYYSLSKKMGWR